MTNIDLTQNCQPLQTQLKHLKGLSQQTIREYNMDINAIIRLYERNLLTPMEAEKARLKINKKIKNFITNEPGLH